MARVEPDLLQYLTEGERRLLGKEHLFPAHLILRSLAEMRRDVEEEKDITATAIDETRRAERERDTAVADLRRCMEALGQLLSSIDMPPPDECRGSPCPHHDALAVLSDLQQRYSKEEK